MPVIIVVVLIVIILVVTPVLVVEECDALALILKFLGAVRILKILPATIFALIFGIMIVVLILVFGHSLSAEDSNCGGEGHNTKGDK